MTFFVLNHRVVEFEPNLVEADAWSFIVIYRLIYHSENFLHQWMKLLNESVGVNQCGTNEKLIVNNFNEKRGFSFV